MFEVVFFQKENGTIPVKEFLNSLDTKMKAKTLRTISLLQINGNELHEPYSKAIQDGIFELRTKVVSDISRVLYFFIGKKVVLTNGFIKKSQKTPKEEIKTAIKYRNEYLSRKDDFDERI